MSANDEAERGAVAARVYDPVDPTAGERILVDRLWPRGVSKEAAHLDHWLKEVAPSGELRVWYGHRADRRAEFGERYRAELGAGPGAEALGELRERVAAGPVVLLTATKEVEASHVTVLLELLGEG